MDQKKLPLGDQSFPDIINENYLYVDKTKHIYDLVTGAVSNYFLLRPRRFGKSLLLDTIHHLFKREDSLFQGLWIERHLEDIPQLPVINLSMSMGSESSDILKRNLFSILRDNAKVFGLDVEEITSDVYFRSLILALSRKSNSKVVVLIDEYDAPVTRNMEDPPVAAANAKTLHDFFATLKDNQVKECVKFTLVTGITRYALTSMDSGPNHLIDISLRPEYAALCGFTLEEFDTYFAGHMEATLEALKKKAVCRKTPAMLI
jgi:hypothetical protein